MADNKKKRDQFKLRGLGIPYDGGQFTTLEPQFIRETEWSWQTVRQSQKILDALPVGICLVLQGKVIYANRHLAETLVGTKASALAEPRFLDLVASEDRQSVENRLRTALATTGSVPVPGATIECADGTRAHARMVIAAITFEGQQAAVVLVNALEQLCPVPTSLESPAKAQTESHSAHEVRHLLDRIDELTQERNDLERKGELLRAIVNDAQDLVFSKDTNLRYTFVNPAMEKLHRRGASEILGTVAENVMPGEAARRVRAVDSRVLAGETVEEIYTTPINETPLTFHGIRTPLRNREGKVVGLFGIVRNITETNQAPCLGPSPTKRTFLPRP